MNKEDWIIEGILPVGLTLLVGLPKSGKTRLAIQLAGACSYGDIFGFKAREQKAAIFLTSDSLPRVQKTVRQMFGEEAPDDMLIRFARHAGKAALPQNMKEVFGDLRETSAIFIDALSDAPTLKQLLELTEFASALGIAIVVIYRSRKNDPAELDGSVGLVACTDAVFRLVNIKDKPADKVLIVSGRDIDPTWYPLHADENGRFLLDGKPGPYKEGEDV